MDWLQRTGLSELAYKNTCRYCMGHAYSKTFFVVYLKFNFIGHPVIFSGNPAGKTSLEGGGHSPSVNQSRRSGLSFRRRDWETAPLYQGCCLGFAFLGLQVFGQPGHRSGLWFIDGEQELGRLPINGALLSGLISPLLALSG